MELTPEEIGNAEFRTVRKGYDPDQVRRLLVGLGARVGRLTDDAERGRREADGIVATARAEADEIVRAARAEAEAQLDGLDERLRATEDAAVARLAAAEHDAAERTARVEQESAERLADMEREAAERAAALVLAGEQAVRSMEHQAGERAERIVGAAADEAGTLVAQAERDAADRLRDAVEEARAEAEAEKSRHRAELERLVERTLFLRAHVTELEGYVDRQEAQVDQVELQAELHRQRLAATITGLQALHDDPAALAGLPRRDVRATSPLPELVLLEAAQASEAAEDEALDVAGELAGVGSDDVEPAFDPDPELVRRFFEEGVYADERWKPRRDRRKPDAAPSPVTAEVPVVPAATMPFTGVDEAITSEPPEEQVPSGRFGSSAPK